MGTPLGIALGALGSIAINSGNNLQSLGMSQLQRRVMEEKVIDLETQAVEEGLFNDEEAATLQSQQQRAAVPENDGSPPRRILPLHTPPRGPKRTTREEEDAIPSIDMELQRMCSEGFETPRQDLSARHRSRTVIDLAKLEEEDIEGEIDSCQSPVWVLGTVIFLTGSLLNFAAFAFAAQSVLASLEGIQFVTNVLFGKFVLGKEISRLMYIGSGVSVLGLVLTVYSASVVGTLEEDISGLLHLWTNPIWIAYLIFSVAFGCFTHKVHIMYEKAVEKGNPLRYSNVVLPATYATFSALFGTFSVVLAKCLSELLTAQIEGVNSIFEHWFTYATLIGWILFVGVWLYRMNEALSLYDPLFIIPLLQVNFILFAIISGGIYFKEFQQFGVLNWCGFILGILTLFTGIFLLSPRGDGKPSEEQIAPEDTTPFDDLPANPPTLHRRRSISIHNNFRHNFNSLRLTAAPSLYENFYEAEMRRHVFEPVQQEISRRMTISEDPTALRYYQAQQRRDGLFPHRGDAHQPHMSLDGRTRADSSSPVRTSAGHRRRRASTGSMQTGRRAHASSLDDTDDELLRQKHWQFCHELDQAMERRRDGVDRRNGAAADEEPPGRLRKVSSEGPTRYPAATAPSNSSRQRRIAMEEDGTDDDDTESETAYSPVKVLRSPMDPMKTAPTPQKQQPRRLDRDSMTVYYDRVLLPASPGEQQDTVLIGNQQVMDIIPSTADLVEDHSQTVVLTSVPKLMSGDEAEVPPKRKGRGAAAEPSRYFIVEPVDLSGCFTEGDAPVSTLDFAEL